MRILVAEDDPASRAVLRATLVRLGHDVLEASDGIEALAVLEREPVPVLITDWVMPDLSGLDLCRAIRETPRPAYTYVILLTGRTGRDSYLEGMRAGADDFIEKPFDADQLAARLIVAERILGRERHVKHLEGLLPICMYCKKIKGADRTWTPVESYISQHSDAVFSHGMCPGCHATAAPGQLARIDVR